MPVLFGTTNADNVLEGNFATDKDVYAFLFIQSVYSLGAFFLTAIMFVKLETGDVFEGLRLRFIPSLKMLALALVAIVAAQFFMELLVNLNKSITLPSALNILKELEQKEADLTEKLLSYTSLGRFFITALVIAVVPALSEEFFFRGLIMGTLLRAKFKPAVAIVLSGLLFALVHLQFSNFLAIWVLGCFLGYLYFVSGSIWLPVTAHFINNFLTVLFKYLFSIGKISKELAEADSPVWLSVAGIAVFCLCVFIFYKWREKVDFAEPDDFNNQTPLAT